MKITKFKGLHLKKLFKGEDTRFLLFTASKIAAVYLIAMTMVAYILWIVLSLNSVFFESKGLANLSNFQDTFFDYLLMNSLENLTPFFFFYVILFFAGIFVGKILVRPFDIIAKHCDDAIENVSAKYNPDIFSDFKLLTRFSDFFFQYIFDSRINKKLEANSIPPTFAGIHQPVFDRVFFFHFSLLISILAIITSIYVSITIYQIYSQMINLALQTLPQDKALNYFLRNQEFIFDSVRWSSAIIIIFTYFFLSIHLYKKVSGAVFAFFATMRSFMRGNHDARVHLLEYRHLRPHGRSLNKLLEQTCREISVVSKEVEDID